MKIKMAISDDFWQQLRDCDANRENVHEQQIIHKAEEVVREFETRFTFPEVTNETKTLLADFTVGCLHAKLQTSSSVRLCAVCLQLIRILSRDSNGIGALFTDQLHTAISLLIRYSTTTDEQPMSEQLINDVKIMIECQKCFCNAIYHNDGVRRKFVSDKCLEGLCLRLENYCKEDSTIFTGISEDDAHFLMLYDLRVLFLITATRAETRDSCFKDLSALESLTTLFERNANKLLSEKGEKAAELCCESLKALFNITIDAKRKTVLLEESVQCCTRVVVAARGLLAASECPAVTLDLRNHIINSLTVLPTVTYQQLAPTIPQDAAEGTENKAKSIYQNRDMGAMDALVDVLEQKLKQCMTDDENSLPDRNATEELSPVVSLLADVARSSDVYRKYLKFKILPPLAADDVQRRPEAGSTLRNRLCRLMTSAANIQALAADLLFELCARNVDRLVKYTGFGNAAGLLANYGLLGHAAITTSATGDNDDSDTEEYLAHRDEINPVVGCVTPPKTNPLEGMSEEQKEYEAMKLVDQINKLMDQGLIKPAKVDADGKVQECSHILEMAPPTPPEPSADTESDEA